MIRTCRLRFLSRKQRSRKPCPPTLYRPCLEVLEGRLLLSTFDVINTNDSGAGSLRQAILNANDTPGSNVIDFNIAGSGVQTINLLSALPTITNPVTIDGSSQPGFAGAPLIVLNGSSAGSSANGLTITAGNSTVKDLMIDNFSAEGIVLQTGGSDVLAGNYIGVDSTGAAAAGNYIGIYVTSGNNTIGGTTTAARNVIAGNVYYRAGFGVEISGSGATGNMVEGNYIGTDATGTEALRNGLDGVSINNGAADNTIGGTVTGALNVISGNTDSGVDISDSGTTGNVVEGNYIGTDLTGTKVLGNGSGVLIGAANNTVGGTASGAGNVISANTDDGVEIAGNGNLVEGNYIGTNVTGTAALGNGSGVLIEAANNTVGGTAAGARNIISGNTNDGVYIDGSGTNDNLVQGNFIGTDKNGTAALGNGQNGVDILGGASNTIGGTFSGAGNVISANGTGVAISTSSATGNLVQGNYIGTDKNGTAALGNGYGVFINAAADNTVGGTVAAARNVISANTYSGVQIADSGATGNLVQGNYIGTDVSGTAALGNGYNVFIDATASNNTIGGTASGAGNVIAYSDNDGVTVQNATGNAIRQNSIYSSSNLGIELQENGNNNQPAPVLTSANTNGSIINIQGTLNATANTNYALDFFANPTANPSGYGEGKQFLGSATVMTNSGGTASFTVTFTASVPAGQAISATATDPTNNTSAFAKDITAASGFTITPTFDSSITNDPNATAIENTINTAIQNYENTYSNPIDVQIYFKEMSSASLVGRSQWEYYDFGYQDFLQGLAANQAISGQSDQATALAHLPNQPNNPVTNTPDLGMKVADVKALGLGNLLGSNYGVDQNGNSGGPYDGVISLTTSETFPPQPNNGENYSLLVATEHEIDEVLGLGSSLNLGTGYPFAEDLYRYDSSGNRNFTTSGDNAYFSIDGTTDLVQFNQAGNGSDYGDWHTSGTPRVQDAFLTPGATPSLGVELTALDVVGYDRINSGDSILNSGPVGFTPSLPVVPSSHSIGMGAARAAGNTPTFAQSGKTSSVVGLGGIGSPSSIGGSNSLAAVDSVAAALAAPGPAASVGDAHNDLFTLLSNGGQLTSPLGGSTSFRPAETAQPPLASHAGEDDLTASQHLDLFHAAALVNDWSDLSVQPDASLHFGDDT